MDDLLLISGFVFMCAAWLRYANNSQTIDLVNAGQSNIFDDVKSSVSESIKAVEGLAVGALNLGKMRGLNRALLNNQNVKAMLQTIRRGEGTLGADGYKTLFGGRKFSSFADHPRQKITAGRYTSTAAGAYQFLSSVWDETARIMGLTSFTPENQDYAALGRIAARGALDDVINGRFFDAINKLRYEWASLPNSPYGQPTQNMTAAVEFYKKNGGKLA